MVRVEELRSRGARTGSRRGASRSWRPRLKVAGTILRWVVLIEFVYVFTFPLIYMVTTSIKTLSDLNNPSVHWIPPSPTLEWYGVAMDIIDYVNGLKISAWTSVAAAVGQTLVGSMVAYGFARVRFPGRGALFAFLLFTVIVPMPTIMIPQFMLYSKIKWTNTYAALFVPAFLGWGVRGGILLIVYRQFLRGLPYELEDAARVDGAGHFRTFGQVILPLSRPAVLVVFVFSLTWTWNDEFVPWLVINDRRFMTLTQRVQACFHHLLVFDQVFIPPSVHMAAITLLVVPVLVLYIFAQRHFTQSIDRTGLVE